MKKAIDWFALVIGLALALFGAKWMWTGWDIVQAERGWAALISGSVMLSGGLIVAMLAWTIMRLTGASMPAREAQSAVDVTPARPLAPTPPPPAPAIALGAGAAAAATAVGMALARDGSQENEAEGGVKEAANKETPEDEPADGPRTPPAKPPSVSELLRRSEERAPREAFDLDALEDGPGPARPPVAPPLPTVAPPPAPPPPPAPLAADEVEKEIPSEPAAAEEKPKPPPAPVVAPPDLPETSATTETPVEPAPVEPDEAKADSEPEPPRLSDAVPPPPPVDEPVYDDWLERTAREFDRELGRDKMAKDEAEPPEPPAPAPAQSPESAIVGRYSSGDTNYLMFADGSIEAQTPDGVMRFASLTELKRFVEKRN